ncbi:MAG: hypothetical protein ACJ751_18025 [Niastella sp.]|uniref:hypothetical protein n=1 Tax=Niastella sp. TaxID=1869183 RepID=UPI0038998510
MLKQSVFYSTSPVFVTIKVFSPQGKEYGRVRQTVKGKKGDAFYVDFAFDSRTNIDGKGTISFE